MVVYGPGRYKRRCPNRGWFYNWNAYDRCIYGCIIINNGSESKLLYKSTH